MKQTKRSLWSSGLALMLCLAMLAGTTFAWFTDSVSSKNNHIQAGTLDLTFAHLVDGTYEEFNENTPPVFDYDLWEPGYTAVSAFRIGNNGSLALKYRLDLVLQGGASKLAEVIDVYYYSSEQAITALPSDFDTVKQTYTRAGTLADVINGTNGAASGHLSAQTAVYTAVALHMQEDAGNDYQSASVGTTFDIVLKATQYTEETDGFGNSDYDAAAEFAADKEWFDPSSSEYSLSTPEALAGLSELVAEGNSFKGKTVSLSKDISLDGKQWTPIGTDAAPFEGSFDGNGHTVSDIQTNAGTDAGFFGVVKNAVISGLTIKGGHVDGTGKETGALAGKTIGTTVSNVVVDGVTLSGKSYTGGLIGHAYTGKIEGCTVKNSTISGGAYMGGITGQGYASINNTSVEGCTINASAWKAGGIIGQVNEGNVTFNKLTVKDTVINGNGSPFGAVVGFSNYGKKTFNDCAVINCTLASNDSVSGAAGFIGQFSTSSGSASAVSFHTCRVTGLSVKAGSTISNVGGFLGNGYWRGYKDLTVTFDGCTAEIASAAGTSVSDTGAFVGDGKDNTFVFTGENRAVTTGTTITELIGKKGTGITVTGEDTVTFLK